LTKADSSYHVVPDDGQDSDQLHEDEELLVLVCKQT